ncbi:threonine synthase [Helicobacter didelphidarum]|uniref:Threonine synthase n=1 Tax=Helicobacter didelphidarum TaxID=2040648 RepID=A0A3D8ILX6_9HELI|nr:threonine synthase [Helicobacter didelphidarum]RDU66229.1 threonine synthase [Helicobacter didelphidarum]
MQTNNETMLAQTRSNTPTNKTFVQAMLNPNADFGGLYTFGKITPFENLTKIYALSYTEICKEIFQQLHIHFDSHLLESALQSYQNFGSKDIAPLVKIYPNLYSLELYHGPTYAFKDMALQPFSKLLDSIATQQKKKYLILSATSGDTGPATLQGFAHSKNVKAICIYPKGGTSEVQRLQMTTQDAPNLKVFGIYGDFDLAQSTLKSLLRNKEFNAYLKTNGYELSAANSVNIARIAFQIVYYFKIAKDLAKENLEEFSVIIPSGNFGNALGAFFAKQLGLPIKKICIASNPNDILTQFFTTGVYDIREKELKLSYSPAMDILKSSNIERLLFAYFGADRTKELMESLENNAYFNLTDNELNTLQNLFEAKSFSDKECLQGIKESFASGYIIDPHTSNAYLFAKERQNKNETQVIISTAHFSKFAKVVFSALSGKNPKDLEALNDKEALHNILAIIHSNLDTNVKLDFGILNIFTKKEIHTQSYNANELDTYIMQWIGNEMN